MITVICGAPCAGKSTYARKIGPPGASLWHLDALIATHSWSEQSEAAQQYLEVTDGRPVIVEGCAAGRMLRKWLERHPTGRPCDRIIRLTEPLAPQTPGQARLAKGEATIWSEIEPQLRARGVALELPAGETTI